MKVICVGTKNFEKINVVAMDFRIFRTYEAFEEYGVWSEYIGSSYYNQSFFEIEGYRFPQSIFEENFKVIDER